MTLRDPRDLEGALYQLEVSLKETVVTLHQQQLQQLSSTLQLLTCYSRFLEKEEENQQALKKNLMATQDMHTNHQFFKEVLAKALSQVKAKKKHLLLKELIREEMMDNPCQ